MDFLDEELRKIKDRDMYRHLRRVEGPQGPSLLINGKEMLSLASNNYLGLADHPFVIQRTIDAVEKWGTGSGASRLITGNTSVHEALEERIARFKGTEASILFNTGFMANLGILTSLMGPGDTIFSDELNHASIIDGTRLSRAEVVVYNHRDLEDLELKLRKHEDGKRGGRGGKEDARKGSGVDTRNPNRKLIVTDGVFSMDGTIAPLPGLVELKEQFNAILMVDDAHGTGVMGENGKGTSEHFGLPCGSGGVDINMGTLSKAMGSEGGFVAGSRGLIDFLRNRARSFIFTTAIAPGSAAASLASFKVLEQESWRISILRENAALLRDGLREMGFRVSEGITPIIPVIIGSSKDTLEFSKELEEKGIFVPAIRPPTVREGTGRLRATVMATHTREQLEWALDVFGKAGRKIGIL